MKYFFSIRHTEQVHGKFQFCCKNSLNPSREWHSFKFAGKLFHKSLSLSLNEFIPYLWGSWSEIRKETLFPSEYEYILCTWKFRLIYIFQWLRIANVFYESSINVLSQVKRLSYLAMQLFYTIWKVLYFVSQLITFPFLRKTFTWVDIR